MDVQLASACSMSSYNPSITVSALYRAGATSGRSATAWGTANRAILIPCPISGLFTIKRLSWENGTVSGNVDMGVYTSTFQLVTSTGSTAQAGTTFQTVNITDVTIPPGMYYLALVLDNGTGQIACSTFGTNPNREIGVFFATGSFPLPATISPISPTSNLWPSMQAMAVDVI